MEQVQKQESLCAASEPPLPIEERGEKEESNGRLKKPTCSPLPPTWRRRRRRRRPWPFLPNTHSARLCPIQSRLAGSGERTLALPSSSCSNVCLKRPSLLLLASAKNARFLGCRRFSSVVRSFGRWHIWNGDRFMGTSMDTGNLGSPMCCLLTCCPCAFFYLLSFAFAICTIATIYSTVGRRDQLAD